MLLWVVAMALAANVAFVSIAKGDASEQDTARQVVARTPAEWQALWKAHAGDGKLPVVDFASNMVVGVFLGMKPTSGYDVEIVSVQTDGDALVVQYRQRRPARDAMTAQILTQPFHVIAVARHADPVRFAEINDVK
jgi:hypothetical protein